MQYSILPLLGLLFVGLKLGHVIAWSWWWVLAPFWVGIPLMVLIFIVVFVVALLVM